VALQEELLVEQHLKDNVTQLVIVAPELNKVKEFTVIQTEIVIIVLVLAFHNANTYVVLHKLLQQLEHFRHVIQIVDLTVNNASAVLSIVILEVIVVLGEIHVHSLNLFANKLVLEQRL
jgi:hypothetical protein